LALDRPTRAQPIIDHGHEVCVLTNGDGIAR
jgi:hypothetical protein